MRLPAALLLALAACAPAPPPAGEAPAVHPQATVWFEPPLPEPGALTVVHESGYRWSGAVAGTQAAFPAPEGPCTLVLTLGGERFEAVWKVAADARSRDWEWGR